MVSIVSFDAAGSNKTGDAERPPARLGLLVIGGANEPGAKTVIIGLGNETHWSVRDYAKKLDIAIIVFTVVTVICLGCQIYKEVKR